MRESQVADARVGRLDPAEQHQDKHDDEDRANTAGRVIAPSAAVRPRRNCADQHEDENDEKYSSEHHSILPIRRWTRDGPGFPAPL
jgi:hypothetical protein